MNKIKIKKQNEKWLKSHGIEVNPHLPVIEDIINNSIRSTEEISSRSWALLSLIGIGYDHDGHEMLEPINRRGLKKHLTSSELEFLIANKITQRDRWEAVELCHCIHALTWVLGYRELEPLGKCPDDVSNLFFSGDHDVISFATLAKPRKVEELYTMSDLLYRLHWSANNAELKNIKFPVSSWTIMNRRKAIDWCINPTCDWDDIPIDT